LYDRYKQQSSAGSVSPLNFAIPILCSELLLILFLCKN
jgi:hypothetical protein